NLLPTNHKFYGALDYTAFSNLNDLYLEGRWSPTKTLALSAAVHDFRLIDRDGPWVGGSGPFSDRELGYVFRRPAGGRFQSNEIGRELDFAAIWSLPPGMQLKFEGGIFRGGAAAREVLALESDGSWASLEFTYKL
ncbi:MAG: alginate export family protein, partial [Thermoanaerobaculia bacterium]